MRHTALGKNVPYLRDENGKTGAITPVKPKYIIYCSAPSVTARKQ